jgi:hypothetical protein
MNEKQKEALKVSTIAEFKKMYKHGTRIYTALKHVSSSGMTRHISVYAVKKGEIQDITWYAHNILDYKLTKGSNALVVVGCGMDMGYHVVSSLANAVFGYLSPEKERANGTYTNCYGYNHTWL